MGFVAKGKKILIQNGSSEETKSYLYKRMNHEGVFEDVNYGSVGADFDSPITSSAWTTYGGYMYMNLGNVRQIYSDVRVFNRNMRFDSLLRLSNTVAPVGSDLSNVSYITAVVKGTLTDDISTISQTVIDEFSAGEYTNVLAIGVMNRDIEDYRAINIDVNDIKTFAGCAEIVQDYNLPITEAIYLVNLVITATASMSDITSLSVNVYQQEFIEFFGDSYVSPGSIGKTEMNPDYKAERAINNYIITITDEYIVDGTVILAPDVLVQLDDNTIYYMNFATTNEPTISNVSLGYYDMETSTYVASGESYEATVSGTVQNKVCIAALANGAFTIKSLL